MLRFWSLTRSGLTPVSGRPTLRAFRAAWASCGRPQLVFELTADRTHRFLEVGLQFHSGKLFRCLFSTRSFRWSRHLHVWYTRNGQPRAFKPSNFDNPISRALNASLVDGSAPRNLKRWERVLLALGF